MKIETINLDKERKLITLLIMHDAFCEALIPVIKPDTLVSPYARKVAEWCHDYYTEYKVAPKQAIMDIYYQKSIVMNNNELVESIKVFLDKLFAEYSSDTYTNLPFFINEANDYVRSCNLTAHCVKINALTAAGKLEQAEAEISNFQKVCVQRNNGISLLQDTDTIVDMLKDSREPLFRLDGDLGKVTGNLYRQDFAAAVSSMKGTKSWFLQYVGEVAAINRLKVCHIDLEMRPSDPLQRFVRGLISAPLEDMDVSIPKFVCYDTEITDASMFRIEHNMVHKKGITLDKDKMRQELSYRLHGGGDIVTFSLPSGVTTVKDIEALLDNLERYRNYVPDVLTIDYCDLLGSAERDYRQKLNDIWLNLRRVAQQRNIFVCTVTQSTKAGLGGKELHQGDISEDIRKLAHVTNFWSIYGTKEQQKNDFCIVDCLDSRNRHETWDAAVVLRCLDIGRWYIDSKFKKNVCE